jgi:hypothetical protein
MLLLPTAAGLVATAAMSVVAVIQLGVEVVHPSPLGAGLSMIALGLAWTVVVVLRLVPSRQLGVAVGTGLALVGAQLPTGADSTVAWAYVLTFALAVGCFLGYRFLRSVVLLVAGVVGVTVAVPEAVNDWTGGAVGGAAVLVLAGSVLIVASGLGLRMRRTAA